MIEIYGSSDDLIEIEGDVCEEFTYDEYNDNLIIVSTGHILRIRYDDQGVWRITPVSGPIPSVTQAPENDEDNHSDRAKIEGAVRWVALAQAIAWNENPDAVISGPIG